MLINVFRTILIFSAVSALLGCSTPESEFGVYRQSNGTVEVHRPKSAKDTEAQEAAAQECKKLGKQTATIVESRKTVNDRFPMTYIYVCR